MNAPPRVKGTAMEDRQNSRTGTPSPQTYTLRIRVRLPGKPVVGVVTSRPDANGAVCYRRLGETGVPVQGAEGSAMLPL